jgi:hypothetical protein
VPLAPAVGDCPSIGDEARYRQSAPPVSRWATARFTCAGGVNQEAHCISPCGPFSRCGAGRGGRGGRGGSVRQLAAVTAFVRAVPEHTPATMRRSRLRTSRLPPLLLLICAIMPDSRAAGRTAGTPRHTLAARRRERT